MLASAGALAACRPACRIEAPRASMGPVRSKRALPRCRSGVVSCTAAATQSTSPDVKKASKEFAALAAEFGAVPEGQDRYKLLLKYAATLPPLSGALKTLDNRVMGCTSQTWVAVTVDPSSGAAVISGEPSPFSILHLVSVCCHYFFLLVACLAQAKKDRGSVMASTLASVVFGLQATATRSSLADSSRCWFGGSPASLPSRSQRRAEPLAPRVRITFTPRPSAADERVKQGPRRSRASSETRCCLVSGGRLGCVDLRAGAEPPPAQPRQLLPQPRAWALEALPLQNLLPPAPSRLTYPPPPLPGTPPQIEAIRTRARRAVLAGPQQPFPSLVISADSLEPRGAFAEMQATYLKPDRAKARFPLVSPSTNLAPRRAAAALRARACACRPHCL